MWRANLLMILANTSQLALRDINQHQFTSLPPPNPTHTKIITKWHGRQRERKFSNTKSNQLLSDSRTSESNLIAPDPRYLQFPSLPTTHQQAVPFPTNPQWGISRKRSKSERGADQRYHHRPLPISRIIRHPPGVGGCWMIIRDW